MEVLQRNDWPEPDNGVQTAFNFTMPADEGPGGGAGSVRSWRAEEAWLDWPAFHALLHTGYPQLLNCDSWRMASPLVFPSSRTDGFAVQAVEVVARPRPPGGSPTVPGPVTPEDGLRPYTFTFCLERAEKGPYKDCWLISGVRVGNYAL